MKRLLILLMALPSSALGKGIEVTTDRFTGETTASISASNAIQGLNPKGSPGSILSAQKIKNKDGNISNKLQIAFVSTRWFYLNCNGVYWLVDSKPFEMPKPIKLNDAMRGGVSEYFGYTITEEQFKALAAAESIEFKVCNDEYRINDNGLNVIRALHSTALN